MRRRKATVILTALGMMVLILDSKRSISSAAQGVDLCIRTVIPSLFPFFLVSILLTGSMGSSPILIPLERLFRARNCGPILVTGLLGGYPVGAHTASQEYKLGSLTREQANYLLSFCSQAGPSFLFGMAAGRFPDRKYAWMLWAVQILSSLCVARMQPVPVWSKKPLSDDTAISLGLAMKKAVSAMASVCGWVILFRVIICFFQTFLFRMLPQSLSILLSGLMELTNGCLLLEALPDPELRFLCCAIMLNFGGLCVMMQTASVIDGLDFSCYIRGKLLQVCFAAPISLALLGYYASLIPVCIIFFLPSLRNLRKNSSIPASFGV